MTALLQVTGLTKHYPGRDGVVQALRGVDFEVGYRETVALVGESGCGKSTAAMTLMRLSEPDSGSVTLGGADLGELARRDRRALGKRLSIVFQNPYSSLDPRQRIRNIVGEPLKTAFGLSGRPLEERVAELLEQVGLTAEQMRRYPHELSGGQRQRVAIARSLALEPELLVLDEPTAALDVSVQAQVLNLLQDLQERLDLSYLLITHDLSVVEVMAARVLVMYLGRIVESGPVEDVFGSPRHPYTRSLLDSIPIPDPRLRAQLKPPLGEAPSPLNLPAGCAFAPRCPRASERCKGEDPALAAEGRRAFACFHPLEKEFVP
ncbi:MAG: ATP-binding cassette domain-containing protein [Rhodovibrionaceae bacterium]|nr:ATP-binding cassette domain-containing protein [Rhodovibrionaceae bacterium]